MSNNNFKVHYYQGETSFSVLNKQGYLRPKAVTEITFATQSSTYSTIYREVSARANEALTTVKQLSEFQDKNTELESSLHESIEAEEKKIAADIDKIIESLTTALKGKIVQYEHIREQQVAEYIKKAEELINQIASKE